MNILKPVDRSRWYDFWFGIGVFAIIAVILSVLWGIWRGVSWLSEYVGWTLMILSVAGFVTAVALIYAVGYIVRRMLGVWESKYDRRAYYQQHPDLPNAEKYARYKSY